MKNVFILIIFIFASFLFIGCSKDDSDLSKPIFEKYEQCLNNAGYILNKVDATNNVSSMLNIVDKDVVNIHKAISDKPGTLYIYLFPTKNKAKQWYSKINEILKTTNYKAILDEHYILVILGDNIYDLVVNIK